MYLNKWRQEIIENGYHSWSAQTQSFLQIAVSHPHRLTQVQTYHLKLLLKTFGYKVAGGLLSSKEC